MLQRWMILWGETVRRCKCSLTFHCLCSFLTVSCRFCCSCSGRISVSSSQALRKALRTLWSSCPKNSWRKFKRNIKCHLWNFSAHFLLETKSIQTLLSAYLPSTRKDCFISHSVLFQKVLWVSSLSHGAASYFQNLLQLHTRLLKSLHQAAVCLHVSLPFCGFFYHTLFEIKHTKTHVDTIETSTVSPILQWDQMDDFCLIHLIFRFLFKVKGCNKSDLKLCSDLPSYQSLQ